MGDKGGLVRLLDLDSDFIIELRYATADNFTGKKIYGSSECYINKGTAELLIRARDLFRRDGHRVKIWDAYRPLRAQQRFIDFTGGRTPWVGDVPKPGPGFVYSARHLNGMSVDMTLCDESGKELEMPTGFDSFTAGSALENNDSDSPGYRNASYMKAVMESVGFENYRNEWWHFDDRVHKPTPYTDYEL